MEALIAETIAKRNFDIEQINTNMNMSTNMNADTGQTPDEWLKPNNTSLRSEKQQPPKENDIGQRKHKYVNVNVNDLEKEPALIGQLSSPSKKVSFNEGNNVTMTIEEYMEPQAQDIISIPTNIFNKLKKVEEPNVQAQINDMNKKIDTLFAMMSELSSNVKQIASSR